VVACTLPLNYTSRPEPKFEIQFLYFFISNTFENRKKRGKGKRMEKKSLKE
jgi:hypothetical protein